MKKLALAFTLLPAVAFGADIPTKAPVSAPITATYCTPTECTGFYFGGHMDEAGGSLNVVATGLSGLATNQFSLGADLGYQYWDGKWFLAAELLGDYGLTTNGSIPGGGNSALWGFGALAKIGYNLIGAITPNGSPSLPAGLTVIAPYAIVGDWTRSWGSGFAAGAGIEGWLANNLTVHIDYIHVNYNNAAINPIVTQQTEDMVIGGIDYHL